MRSTPSSLPHKWNFKGRPCAIIYGKVAGEEVQRWGTGRDAECEQTCCVFWMGRGIGRISRNMVRGRSSRLGEPRRSSTVMRSKWQSRVSYHIHAGAVTGYVIALPADFFREAPVSGKQSNCGNPNCGLWSRVAPDSLRFRPAMPLDHDSAAVNGASTVPFFKFALDFGTCISRLRCHPECPNSPGRCLPSVCGCLFLRTPS